jgi:hypothetical protein
LLARFAVRIENNRKEREVKNAKFAKGKMEEAKVNLTSFGAFVKLQILKRIVQDFLRTVKVAI